MRYQDPGRCIIHSLPLNPRTGQEGGLADLMKALGLSHRPTFRKNYLNPAMQNGWIERTQPDSPRSPTQRYRLTGKGRRWLQRHGKV